MTANVATTFSINSLKQQNSIPVELAREDLDGFWVRTASNCIVDIRQLIYPSRNALTGVWGEVVDGAAASTLTKILPRGTLSPEIPTIERAVRAAIYSIAL